MKETQAKTNSQSVLFTKKTVNKKANKSELTTVHTSPGRKPWIPDYAKIENFASNGLKDKEIAALCGVCHEVFSRKKNQLNHPELKNSIELGRAKGTAACSQKLLSMALSGDRQLLMFYLERVSGWTKTLTLENPTKRVEDMTNDELLAIVNGQKI